MLESLSTQFFGSAFSWWSCLLGAMLGIVLKEMLFSIVRF